MVGYKFMDKIIWLGSPSRQMVEDTIVITLVYTKVEYLLYGWVSSRVSLTFAVTLGQSILSWSGLT